MALTPLDKTHALQIQAGISGRKQGHTFEAKVADEINHIAYPTQVKNPGLGNVFIGDPAILLLQYIAFHRHFQQIHSAVAVTTGALATSETGKKWLSINGSVVTKSKSDLVITVTGDARKPITLGVSTKQCNNPRPTNAQVYFTNARPFSNLLIRDGIPVSDAAIDALRQFCGESGFRPSDFPPSSPRRLIDPRRWFWEEIAQSGRSEWEQIFSTNQDRISRLLLQQAYKDDPFVPEYLLHKTKRANSWNTTECAIYFMDDLIDLSHAHGGFSTHPYSIHKGSYKDPPGVTHLAPRFGIIQMQRGGQRQHPEQLQFNLETAYFYKI